MLSVPRVFRRRRIPDRRARPPLRCGHAHPAGRRRQPGPRLQGRRRLAAVHRARAAGARIEDVDGNRYIDYVMSWGPLIHGHAPRGWSRRWRRPRASGTSFGAPSPLEVELGERVATLMPSIERVRFVSSGTEAAMSAVRVARAATGRDRHHQVRGLLSRPRRSVPGQGGLGRADARRADQPGRDARRRPPTRWSRATTISNRCGALFDRQSRRRLPRSSSSRSPATWASCRRPTDFCAACARSAPRTARC